MGLLVPIKWVINTQQITISTFPSQMHLLNKHFARMHFIGALYVTKCPKHYSCSVLKDFVCGLSEWNRRHRHQKYNPEQTTKQRAGKGQGREGRKHSQRGLHLSQKFQNRLGCAERSKKEYPKKREWGRQKQGQRNRQAQTTQDCGTENIKRGAGEVVGNSAPSEHTCLECWGIWFMFS